MDRLGTVVAEDLFDQVTRQGGLALARLGLDHQESTVVPLDEPLHVVDDKATAHDVGMLDQQFTEVGHPTLDDFHPAFVSLESLL